MAPLQYSFGIELEYILIFPESKLTTLLKEGEHIIKSLSMDQARKLVTNGYGNQVIHSSWALSTHDSQITAYRDEPLRIAHQIISGTTSFEQIDIFFDTNYETKHDDYSKWTICGDPSLQGLSREEITEISQTSDTEEFDSWGIELVSPVIANAGDPTVFASQMKDLMNSLQYSKEQKVGATINDHCGFHVHIGRPDNSDFDVKTIQYLALIITVYEDEIFRLCAPHRSNDPESRKSNRENLISEYEPISRKEGTLLFPYISIQRVREMLSLDTDIPQSPTVVCDRIIRTMGKWRGKFVNFSYLKRKNGRAQTIEFRQHEGTMDPVAITSWIKVCHGLVSLAEQFASSEKPFPVSCWDDQIYIFDLLNMMNVDSETQAFYRQKLQSQGDEGSCRSMEHLYEPYIPFEDELE